MSRHTIRLYVLLLLLLPCLAASAAPPATLGYQGRLATAGGLPVSGTLNITFRLYDTPGGGSPLWSETQPAVDVDGGNLAVELGKVVPLPTTIWGRQLYLGVQVAGDSEMLPRPALTAAPYALRAGATMQRTLVVSAVGTPAQNGAALLAAVAGITDASVASPVAVEIDAGTFDLGTATLHPPEHTSLIGRGQGATIITSHAATITGNFAGAATVLLRSHSSARDLTVRNTGVPSGIPSFSVIGIGAFDPDNFQQLLVEVLLVRVSGESFAAPGSEGQRAGISLCVADSRVADVTGIAEGGQYGMGMRIDCPAASNVVVDGAELRAALSSNGLRGAYLSAGRGNVWRRLKVRMDIDGANPPLESVFGLRFLPQSGPGSVPQGVLSDSSIVIASSGTSAPNQIFLFDGIRVDNLAQLARIERVSVQMDNVRANARIHGLILRDQAAGSAVGTRLIDVDASLSGLSDSGTGGMSGLLIDGYPPEVTRATIRVDCLTDSQGPCTGVMQNYYSWTPPGGEFTLDHSTISVSHAGIPAGGAAHSAAFWAMGPSRIGHTRLRLASPGDASVSQLLSIHAPAAIHVSASTLTATDASDSNAVCVLAGPTGASVEWFGNHVQGMRCDGGQLGLTCAGNTQRGTGFLGNACP